MKDQAASFSLTIGSLSIILFSVLLMGILAGLYSITHFNYAGTSETFTSLAPWTFVVPIIILIKGIREAEEV